MSMLTIDTASAEEAAEAWKKAADEFASKPADTQWSIIKDNITSLFPKLLAALIILAIGFLCIRMIKRFLKNLLLKSKLDPALHNFTLSILNVALYILLFILALSVLSPAIFGSLIAVLSVLGLAVSLAVKDSLANIAGGIAILFTHPFSLGDHVQIDSSEGVISEIRLNYTILKTFDNKIIHIPNGDVAKAKIVNVTHEPIRRLDIDFMVGRQSDFDHAKQIITEILEHHPLALSDPAPIVRVMEQKEAALVIGCRVWCNTPDYMSLKFDLLEDVKRKFDAAGICFPNAQVDVYLPPPKNDI